MTRRSPLPVLFLAGFVVLMSAAAVRAQSVHTELSHG